eukprot:3690985-Amphidinium_carterae.1
MRKADNSWPIKPLDVARRAHSIRALCSTNCDELQAGVRRGSFLLQGAYTINQEQPTERVCSKPWPGQVRGLEPAKRWRSPSRRAANSVLCAFKGH